MIQLGICGNLNCHAALLDECCDTISRYHDMAGLCVLNMAFTTGPDLDCRGED